MTPKTLEKLQHFCGKVCSIMTTSINRTFNEEIAREHFVIFVDTITADGIIGTHPYNPDLISYFRMEHVVSIHQEEVLDPTNPEHQAMMKEFEQKTGKPVRGDLKADALKKAMAPIPPKKESKADYTLPIKNVGLPILDKKPVDLSTGDSEFIDIESLERLAEQTQQAFTIQDQCNNSLLRSK